MRSPETGQTRTESVSLAGSCADASAASAGPEEALAGFCVCVLPPDCVLPLVEDEDGLSSGISALVATERVCSFRAFFSETAPACWSLHLHSQG